MSLYNVHHNIKFDADYISTNIHFCTQLIRGREAFVKQVRAISAFFQFLAELAIYTGYSFTLRLKKKPPHL